MNVQGRFIGVVCRPGEGSVGRYQGGAHTFGALDIALNGGGARGPGLYGDVELVHAIFHALLDVSHFFGEIRLHFGDGISKGIFTLLDLCELFVQGRDLVLAALDNGREDLSGLLGAVRELFHEALVYAEFHSLLNVGGVGLHIGNLALEGLNQAINGGFGRAVEIIKEPELSLDTLDRFRVALLVGRL